MIFFHPQLLLVAPVLQLLSSTRELVFPIFIYFHHAPLGQLIRSSSWLRQFSNCCLLRASLSSPYSSISTMPRLANSSAYPVVVPHAFFAFSLDSRPPIG